MLCDLHHHHLQNLPSALTGALSTLDTSHPCTHLPTPSSADRTLQAPPAARLSGPRPVRTAFLTAVWTDHICSSTAPATDAGCPGPRGTHGAQRPLVPKPHIHCDQPAWAEPSTSPHHYAGVRFTADAGRGEGRRRSPASLIGVKTKPRSHWVAFLEKENKTKILVSQPLPL